MPWSPSVVWFWQLKGLPFKLHVRQVRWKYDQKMRRCDWMPDWNLRWQLNLEMCSDLPFETHDVRTPINQSMRPQLSSWVQPICRKYHENLCFGMSACWQHFCWFSQPQMRAHMSCRIFCNQHNKNLQPHMPRRWVRRCSSEEMCRQMLCGPDFLR